MKIEAPCDYMYFDEPEIGTYLMFERDLTQTEMQSVRENIPHNSHWADNHTLCILQNPETD